MLLLFPSWEKPLSDKEITDFLESPISDPERLWFPMWKKDLTKRVWITDQTGETKRYTTKKAIRQDIAKINEMLELWLTHQQKAMTPMAKAYAEITLEDLFKIKDKLKDRLRYVGEKFDNNDLERAKQQPISHFIEFNSAGFAKCLWHIERHGSLKYYPKTNMVYCFAGCGKKDVLDVIQQLNSCDFSTAIKFLNNNL